MQEIGDKMVGVWQITTIPLFAVLHGDNIIINSSTGRQLSSIPTSLFFGLEPKEIVEVIDKQMTQREGRVVSILRKDFSGHKKNPFSSQN